MTVVPHKLKVKPIVSPVDLSQARETIAQDSEESDSEKNKRSYPRLNRGTSSSPVKASRDVEYVIRQDMWPARLERPSVLGPLER